MNYEFTGNYFYSKGGVHSFVDKLTGLKITPDRAAYYFDWLHNCSIFACVLLYVLHHF